MKTCLACQIKKDILAFYDLKDNDQDFHSVCKHCREQGHKEPAHVKLIDKELIETI